jgi:hypothetical protein
MVAEVMYHPLGPSAAGEDEAPTIELYNNRQKETFEPNTLLGPKQYIVVAYDPNASRPCGLSNGRPGRFNNGGGG